MDEGFFQIYMLEDHTNCIEEGVWSGSMQYGGVTPTKLGVQPDFLTFPDHELFSGPDSTYRSTTFC